MTTVAQKTPLKKGRRASTLHVENLLRTYKKERWIHNSEKLGAPDSLSTWYGLAELYAFLETAKAHQADGIKIYYGVYPEDYSDAAYAGRQTVVLVATRQKETSHGVMNKNIYTQRNGATEILAFNFGHVCPPDCLPPLGNPGDDNGWWGLEMEKTGITIMEVDGQIKIA